MQEVQDSNKAFILEQRKEVTYIYLFHKPSMLSCAIKQSIIHMINDFTMTVVNNYQ